MPPVFKSIAADEQEQALDLWHRVFGVPREYFARYYAVDPWYRPGDSLGAWADGALVSAVHLCRRPLAWEGASLLCGGIANVATRPEYRGRGLSRQLLSRMITHMVQGGFGFSILGTGIPDFYAAHGWETITLPRFELPLAAALPPLERELRPAAPTKDVSSLYAQKPRVLQLERPEPYFQGWVGWNWLSEDAQALTLPGGYVVLQFPKTAGRLVNVREWRAHDAETEIQLLGAAAAQGRARGCERAAFAALPQHVSVSALDALGTVGRTYSTGQMIRNVGLSESDFRRVQEACLSGQAAWWSGDGF